MFERDRPAAGVAGLCQSGGGRGVCALEGRAPADRGRVPSRRLRRALGRRAASIPGATRPPDPSRGLFDFAILGSGAVGSHPAGQSAWGVHDLVGNGWEWTSTVFAPFDGFRPMASYPEYSADFFDGQHFVMKGASPATAARAACDRASATGSARTIRTSMRPSAACGRRVADERTSSAGRFVGPQCGRRTRRRTSTTSGSRSPRPSAFTCSCTRGSCRRGSCTTRWARRCSTRFVICRGTASRAPSCGCFSGTRRRLGGHSAEAAGSSSWAAATARSSRRC